MRISKITIENYRGIKNKQEIPLSSFSSIVGKNDSGKSIVLRAISSFLDISNYQIEQSDFNNISKPIIFEFSFYDVAISSILEEHLKSKIKKEDGLDEFINDIVFDSNIVIRKLVDKVGKSYAKCLIWTNNINDDIFKNLYEKKDTELQKIISDYSIKVPVAGIGRNSKLEKIKAIKQYCSDQEMDITQDWTSDEYKIADLLPGVELFVSDYGLEADTKFKTSSVSEIEDFLREKSKDGDDSTKGPLRKIEDEISNEMQKEAQSIKMYMTDYVSDLQEISIDPVMKWEKAIDGVNVSFKFESDEKLIPMTHKGSGYRRLFMVGRFRYLAEKKKGSDVIFLIEEPETFLHPSAQNDLLNSFMTLSEDNQIIISTHSPVFAGATNYEAVVLCKKESQSIYKTAIQVNKDEFIFEIVDELGIKPYYNLIDNFETILFVESKNDVDFYDILSSMLLDQNLIRNDRLLVLPFGGDNIDGFINIDYFGKSRRNLFLILDSDKHRDEDTQNKQITRLKEFNIGERASGYILQKACIENYYHPRAIERVYGLENNSINIFNDNTNVKNVLKSINEEKGVQIKTKNNMEIYNKMTKEEWQEVVEDTLISFMKLILKYES